jgi:hypothetical protein
LPAQAAGRWPTIPLPAHRRRAGHQAGDRPGGARRDPHHPAPAPGTTGRFHHDPGQHAVLRLHTDQGPDLRPLSIATPPDTDELEFATRIGPSAYKQAFAALQGGDRVKVSRPMGSFRLDPTRPAMMVWPPATPACASPGCCRRQLPDAVFYLTGPAAMEDIGLRRIELDGRVDR